MTPEAMRELAAQTCESGAGDTLSNDDCCRANAQAIRAIPIPPAAAQVGETPFSAVIEKWKDFGVDSNGGVPYDEYQELVLCGLKLERDLAAERQRVAELEFTLKCADDYHTLNLDAFAERYKCDLNDAYEFMRNKNEAALKGKMG